PGKETGSKRTAALVYRYLRPGWSLPIDVERFQDAAVLQALAEQTQLRTVVAEDGQWMTRLTLRIRNNGRQHLAVVLPRGAEVWSAFVDGQPIRPARRDDRLLLPLEASRDRETPVAVEITYVGTAAFPKGNGAFALESPTLDIPLKDARWEVFLPPDYSYGSFGGSMNYEGADLVPVAQDFTLASYRLQEAEQVAAAVSVAEGDLDKVRRGLLSGSFGGVDKLSFYRNSSKADSQAREVETLATEVNRAQASNLMEAQKSYAIANSGQPGEGWGAKKPDFNFGYTAEVALKQAAQVERAQTLAVSRVTPLHVNLPTYGVRHLFAQVLQTETDRPLTLTLYAENDRGAGWGGIILRSIAGFGVLWILSALPLAGAKRMY
ncbi:MAG TPA: hypothetical protein VMF06_24255, partial [Candidatus Limnocylindria bacterium]|nr:hypothetical protein [Candidatus Limnocylindria bacterium]